MSAMRHIYRMLCLPQCALIVSAYSMSRAMSWIVSTLDEVIATALDQDRYPRWMKTAAASFICCRCSIWSIKSRTCVHADDGSLLAPQSHAGAAAIEPLFLLSSGTGEQSRYSRQAPS